MEPALMTAKNFFDESKKERRGNIPKIIIVATDSDISDHEEVCSFVYSKLSDVFFILIDLKSHHQCQRVQDVIDCITSNGIVFDGFVSVYDDLLKQFEPCM